MTGDNSGGHGWPQPQAWKHLGADNAPFFHLLAPLTPSKPLQHPEDTREKGRRSKTDQRAPEGRRTREVLGPNHRYNPNHDKASSR